MQELTINEMEVSSGGVAPVLGFVLAVAGKAAGGGGVGTWAISSSSLILASFELGRYLGSFSRD